MKYILADTGFWIALLDIKDDIKKQSVAKEIFSEIKTANFTILFPTIVYSELLRTKFFKGNKQLKIDNLEKLLKLEMIKPIDDKEYITRSLKITLDEGKTCKSISFVDNIIRLIANDLQNDIKYIITFDKKLSLECQKYAPIHNKCYVFFT